MVENDEITARQTLARANVLRMRGEFNEAIDLCLTVLKIHPDNVEAHVVLGDIYIDRKQYDHAAQWYELALELDPNSGAAQDRLRNLEVDLQAERSSSTQQMLGVQDNTRATNWYAAIAVAIIVFLGVIAFMFSNQKAQPSRLQKIESPIQAKDEVPHRDDSAIIDPPKMSPLPSPVLEQDKAIKELLARGAQGDHIVGATIDPRNNHIIATYRSDDPPTKLTVAQIAKSILEAQPDSPSVTVRLVADNRVVYMADVRRLKLTEFSSLPNADPSPEYFASYVVEDEWSNAVENAATRP